MTYTTLREAGRLVRYRDEFTGNNVYGRWHSSDADHLPERHRRYVVYSYGTHFPMYIYDEDTGSWFGNIDKYSVTTSRHQTTCHPPEVHYWYDTGMMQKIATFGLIPTVQARLTAAPSMMSVAREVA
jgi:hypothetical protein